MKITREKIRKELTNYDIKKEHLESMINNIYDLALDYEWQASNLSSHVYEKMKEYFM